MEKFSAKLLRRFGVGTIILGALLLISTVGSESVSIAKTEYIIAVGIVGIIIGAILVLKRNVSKKTCWTGAVISIMISILSAGTLIALGKTMSVLNQFIFFILFGGLISSIIFIAVLSINKIGENENNKRDPSPAG